MTAALTFDSLERPPTIGFQSKVRKSPEKGSLIFGFGREQARAGPFRATAQRAD
jgi:hypothetical protein